MRNGKGKIFVQKIGGDGQIRTADKPFGRGLLYPLSYVPAGVVSGVGFHPAPLTGTLIYTGKTEYVTADVKIYEYEPLLTGWRSRRR